MFPVEPVLRTYRIFLDVCERCSVNQGHVRDFPILTLLVLHSTCTHCRVTMALESLRMREQTLRVHVGNPTLLSLPGLASAILPWAYKA